jgi:aerobic-type carbon monoxide dehydrogenase small subunit (CoxS/CutS family)
MSAAFDFTLNGQNVRVENISPNTTLLEFLRATGRTGTKEGCAEGDCGACSVAMIESDASGKPTYRAINSCLIPICLLAGREVISVEGVACSGKLHPVQQKMIECHGSQCGYCTPGFIMSLYEGYHRDDLTTAEQLDEQLCGNLCRCTGYRPIREAALAAFADRSAGLRPGALEAEHRAGSETGAPVEYESHAEKFFRPTSLAELFQLIAAHARARILKRDATAARAMPGVTAVLLAEDVPGLNDVGAVRHDETLLADKEISFHGQLVALVVGESQEPCRLAAAKVVVEYEPLVPVLTIPEAIAQNSFHTEANFIRRGQCADELERMARRNTNPALPTTSPRDEGVGRGAASSIEQPSSPQPSPPSEV